MITFLAIAQLIAWPVAVWRTNDRFLPPYFLGGAMPYLIAEALEIELTADLHWVHWFAICNLGLAWFMVDAILPGVQEKKWMKRTIYICWGMIAVVFATGDAGYLARYQPHNLALMGSMGLAAFAMLTAGSYCLVRGLDCVGIGRTLVMGVYCGVTMAVLGRYRWIYDPGRMPFDPWMGDAGRWRLLGLDGAGHLVCLVVLIWMGRGKNAART